MSLPNGTRLGPYEIFSPIGAGGMGEVYRAKDTRLGRDVAVKVLPAEFAADPERLRRFEHEARATAALEHPNILAVHDIGTHEDTPYIVEQLLEGESLRQRLRDGALTPAKAVEFGVQIAQGLAAAHEKGVVHRDLKPENLFVTKDGRIKILDFGLAQLRSQPAFPPGGMSEVATADSPTREGRILGTPGYMAPEQIRGRAADARTDLFAFGVVLYEMLSGIRAFDGDTDADTQAAILSKDPEALPAVTPPSLDRVVRRCLEKRPEDRFHTAHELLLALEVTSSPSGPHSSAISAILPVFLRASKRIWIWGGATVLLLALTVGGLWLWKGKPANPAPAPERWPVRSIAIYPLDDLSGDAAQSYFAPAMTEALNTKLTQIESLRVIGQVSAARCKEEGMPLPEVAEVLGVDAVVQGSVVRVENTVRISVRLLDARSNSNLWAESYERKLSDVLVLQGEVAQAIAFSLSAAITPEEKARLAGHEVDPKAYNLYLEARAQMQPWNDRGYVFAIATLKRVLELEPDFAEAYARIAECYNDAWYTGCRSFPYEVAHPLGKEAALKAVELGPNEAFSHTILAGVLLTFERDLPGAEKEFRRALQLNEREQDALQLLGVVLFYSGRADEAIEIQRRAVGLDPRNPYPWNYLSDFYTSTRQYGEAIRTSEKALEMLGRKPGDGFYSENAKRYAWKGDRAEALRCIEKVKTFPRWDKGPQPRKDLALSYAALGMRPEAEEMMRLTTPFNTGPPGEERDLGKFYAWLGETDRALEHLDRAAFMPGSPGLRIADVGKFPEAFTQDPRYKALLRKYGIIAPK